MINMKLFKKSLGFLFVLLSITATTSTTVFATENINPDNATPRVIQVLIVSEDGNEFYTGKDAERVFSEFNSTKIAAIPVEIEEKTSGTIEEFKFDVHPLGAFSYKYRFLPDARNKTKVYGDYSIISDPWGNATSVQQTATISFTAKSSWSVNCNLTGKYKEVVEGSIGGDWGKEYSVETSHEQQVAPKKRVWLQYRPEYILHSGKAQKYYVARGSGVLIVESSKDVDIREAYMRKITMNGKTYELPV